ncbi:hypothetical protein BX667DRAFT_513579 [Coemansia mojavensis]|nr:hypothetical protein BX667DRAFT_513579 [Coemansia mojavensis]
MPRPLRKAAKRASTAADTGGSLGSLSDQENLPSPKTPSSASPKPPSSASPRYGRRSTIGSSSYRRLSFTPKEEFYGLMDSLPSAKRLEPAPPAPKDGDSDSDEFDIDALLKSSIKKRRRTGPTKPPTPPAMWM